MRMNNVPAISISLVLMLLAACGALSPAPTPTPTATAPAPTPTATVPVPTPTAAVQPATRVQYHFVTNKLQLPTTQAQSEAFALNLDGDPQGHTQNKFGQLLTLLAAAAPGIDLQSPVDQAVNAGQMVTLHEVKADDPLNALSVSWLIFPGQQAPTAPTFDGSDRFIIDSSAPANTPIPGSLTNGHFAGGPGTARVQMFLLGQLVDVDLIGIHVEADVSAKGCANGILGGGVTVDEFRGKLLPAITGGLNQVIKTDPAAAAPLLQVLDSDHNGTLTLQEIENNPLLMLALSPDLDLLDASGKFDPRQDGVADSYSVGLGFTCVPASFTASGD